MPTLRTYSVFMCHDWEYYVVLAIIGVLDWVR